MYASRADLESALTVELVAQAADDGEGSVDEAVIAEVVQRASAVVDSYASGRYPVPFASVPDPVRGATTSIAAYLLLGRRGFLEKSEDSPVVQLYRDALAWLKDVAAGKAQIPGVPGPAAPTQGVGFSSRPQILSESLLKRY